MSIILTEQEIETLNLITEAFGPLPFSYADGMVPPELSVLPDDFYELFRTPIWDDGKWSPLGTPCGWRLTGIGRAAWSQNEETKHNA